MCDPRIDTIVGLIIFIDIIEGKAHKSAVNYGCGIIEGITVGRYGSYELGAARLDAVVKLADTAHEGVAIRLTVTTAEEGNRLAAEIGSLKHSQTVVPIVLQLASALGRGAENEILIVCYHIGCQILYVDDFYAKLRSYLLCDGLACSCGGTENYNSLIHFFSIFVLVEISGCKGKKKWRATQYLKMRVYPKTNLSDS